MSASHAGRAAPAAALVAALVLLGGCQTGPDGDSRAGGTGAQSGTAAVSSPRRMEVDPNRLIGVGRADVQALLGTPALIRREPPAEIWQYQGRACVFDLFLYEEGGTHRVTYLEARDVSAQRVDARVCLNDVLSAAAASPVS